MLPGLTVNKRNWLLAILCVAVLWFAWTVRTALNPLLVGLLFAYILHPLVLQLERRGWSRKSAVNFIFINFGLAMTLMGVLVVAQATALVEDFASDTNTLGRLADRFQVAVEWLLGKLRAMGFDLSLIGVADEAEAGRNVRERFLERARDWITSDEGALAGLDAAEGVWKVAQRFFGSLMATLGFLFLVPLYTWFLLFELERISSFVSGYIPREHREQWTRIGAAMAEMLGGFFRGRLLVCVTKGLIIWLLLLVMGVPYALLLGLLGGVLSLLPVLGPGIGHACVFGVALLSFEPSGALWRTAVVFAIAEAAEGYVLIPKILGDSLGLHTLVVFAALTIFGSAMGMFGLLIALPLTAAIVILARELVLPALREFAEGPHAAASATKPPPKPHPKT
jgi:predicted PurR-regulated permease PerM